MASFGKGNPIRQDQAAAVVIPSDRRARLWAELLLLFVAAPILMATVLPGAVMWYALAAIAVLGVALLCLTRGFHWRQLVSAEALRVDWRILLVYIAVAALVSYGLTMWLVPSQLLSLPRHNTDMWIIIMCAYPFVSAVPQEIVYRVLFFERYGALFPDVRLAILANAGLFGLAHLFYANWPAVVLTIVAGGMFAWAYAWRRSFVFACLLHAVSGQIVFTSGLGILFFHGAIGRF